ncbi:hypothetical protein HPB51_018742 [Rhipicephalus microplus]|uniref:Uncharacterized protein n=1 Tax=Rhipicephalus microplus TaxID=6941 RepID=A0A9J6DI57_RHIMP|nr:hypothetical protein HPB51_018742 [Rhipicephalus microplus]
MANEIQSARHAKGLAYTCADGLVSQNLAVALSGVKTTPEPPPTSEKRREALSTAALQIRPVATEAPAADLTNSRKASDRYSQDTIEHVEPAAATGESRRYGESGGELEKKSVRVCHTGGSGCDEQPSSDRLEGGDIRSRGFRGVDGQTNKPRGENKKRRQHAVVIRGCYSSASNRPSSLSPPFVPSILFSRRAEKASSGRSEGARTYRSAEDDAGSTACVLVLVSRVRA